MMIGAFALGLLAAGSASAAEPGFRAGQWEIVRQVARGSEKKSPQSDTYCITEAQLRADPATLFNLAPAPREGERPPPKCATDSLSMAGGRVKMDATCQVPIGKMKANWSGTYSPTSFDLTGKAKVFMMSVNMTMAGRLLGSCPAAVIRGHYPN